MKEESKKEKYKRNYKEREKKMKKRRHAIFLCGEIIGKSHSGRVPAGKQGNVTL